MTAGYSAVAWQRDLIGTYLSLHRPHTAYAFTEVDITDALAAIARHRAALRVGISMHGWLCWCLGRAAAEHPLIRSARHRGQMVTFDDADVCTTINRRPPGGEEYVSLHVIRRAQTKTAAQVHWEVRQAMRSAPPPPPPRPWYSCLPGWLRLEAFRLRHDAVERCRRFGSVGITNLQTGSLAMPFHVAAPNIYTACLAIGSVIERVRLTRDGRPEARKILCTAGACDHAVLDGIPMARFAGRMVQLMESAAGLGPEFAEETHALMRENPL